MNKLVNYIYYYICEKSLEQYKTTNWRTYRLFSQGFKTSLTCNNLSTRDTKFMGEMADSIGVIFGLTKKESFNYIIDYFLNEKFEIFENTVKTTKNYFRKSAT